jgi:hypothetical protein
MRPIFGGCGYHGDLKPLELYTAGDVDQRFVLGLSVPPAFWKDERQMMDVDRGPCMCYWPVRFPVY